MNHRFCGLMFVVLSLMLLSLARPGQAQQHPEYFYLTLDPPTTMGYGADWQGINNAGEIVGTIVDARTNNYTAALYQNGIFTEVPIPNSFYAALYRVNNHGTAVGGYYDLSGISHSFTRAKDGTITYLPDVVAGGNTNAFCLNDNGVIVGAYSTTPYGNFSGFIYRNGAYKTYNFPGAAFTYLASLNNKNLIVGYYGTYNRTGLMIHSFVLIDSVTFPLAFPGPYQTLAFDINNQGEVVGEFFKTLYNTNVEYGFVLSNDVYTKIFFPGSIATNANGINDDGMIVGTYDTTEAGHGYVAFPVL